jgi:ADP-ribose pyrophosphatase YjhB (NUDIX family)
MKPWQFCPKCGGPLINGTFEGDKYRMCRKKKSCGFVHWDNPLPVCIVLIPTTDGGFILIRRNVPPRVGFVALPGGFTKPFETLLAAAKREAKEETGLDVEIDRELHVLMPPGVNQHLHFFLAKPTSAKPVKGSDAAEAFVCSRDAIPSDIAFDTHRFVITEWLRATA